MDDSVRAWLEAAGRFSLLRPAEEIENSRHVRAWLDHPGGRDAAPAMIHRRGLRARNRLVNCNLRWVVAIVKRRVPATNAEMLDLLQDGSVGLVRAAELYDGTKGYRFTTYSYWWVRQAIGRTIERQNLIHIPCNVQQKIKSGGEVRPELRQAAELAWKPRSGDAPRSISEPGESLLDSIACPCLGTEGAEWREALEAVLAVDPEAVELLQRRADGQTTALLAAAEGMTPVALSKRMLEARRRLRGLVEVEAVLAG